MCLRYVSGRRAGGTIIIYCVCLPPLFGYISLGFLLHMSVICPLFVRYLSAFKADK